MNASLKNLDHLQLSDNLSVPSFMRYRGSYVEMSKANLQTNDSQIRQGSAPDSTDDNGLLNILALQKASGGFEIDTAFARILKISLPHLHDISAKIQAKGGSDKFVLLSTAIVIKF